MKGIKRMKLINFESISESYNTKDSVRWWVQSTNIIGIRTNPNAWSEHCVCYVETEKESIPVDAETAERILKELKEL